MEVALRVTGPAALTTELSIVAVTDWPPFLPIVLVETEAPTVPAPWPPPPRPAARATAKPPESARTLVSSLAVSDTPPPLATTDLLVPPQFVIEAAMVLSTVFVALEPAPARPTVMPCPSWPATRPRRAEGQRVDPVVGGRVRIFLRLRGQ